jgi:hypothetical protein
VQKSRLRMTVIDVLYPIAASRQPTHNVIPAKAGIS